MLVEMVMHEPQTYTHRSAHEVGWSSSLTVKRKTKGHMRVTKLMLGTVICHDKQSLVRGQTLPPMLKL